MKTAFALVGSVAAFVIASPAFAAFTSAQLLDVTKLAVSYFETANPDQVENLVGYKAWKTGEESKVRIYVLHGTMNMEFNYNCQNHDGELDCHVQP